MRESKTAAVTYTPYHESVHLCGRVWAATALVLMLLAPVAVCAHWNAWPEFKWVAAGLLSVAPIYWTTGIIEVLTYAPMLGTGGTYLGFVTGNLSALKAPCAMNALNAAHVDVKSEEGEVLSTIAIAASSIVTTLIIAAGVLFLHKVQPLLESETLQPVFSNILPAMFGALGVVYISKSPKIAVLPLLVMTALFLAAPSLSGAVGVLVPVGILIAVFWARYLYKKGKL